MDNQLEQPKPGIPVAEAIACPSLITYQESSVVSRQILKRASGNVTLFAFDADQGLSEHTTPFDALVHVLEGEVEIVIAGTPLRAKTGDLVVLPAQQPHALRAITKFKMLLTMIRS